MSRLLDDIDATTDSIAVDRARLADVHREQAGRADGEPAMGRLSVEAAHLAEAIERKTAAGRDLAGRLASRPRSV